MPSVHSEGTEGFLSRRGFVQVLASSAGALLLAGCAHLRSHLPPAIGRHPAPRLVTPFVTPNEDFFMVAVDPAFRPSFGPETVADAWRLELAGPGGARRIGYAELSGRARHSVHYTFECIGNPVGGRLIGNALWRVVPLRELLATAPGGTAGARTVRFEGLDGFYSSVSLERATDDYAFLALGMNGVPLPAEHGFPARVILPDLYGKKQPRWLSRIVLQETAGTTSYWEKRLWRGGVPVKTTARLDLRPPQPAGLPLELTGMAFAGARGVRGVEISLDGGEHWVACELVTPARPHVWSLWRYTWPAPTPGRHTLAVRATDGTGAPQIARRQGRWPSGATGYHRSRVEIVPAGAPPGSG
ncbi:MAG TPA: molybdopterin-dependent oxidoreductase [Longimicrobiaceae bacterium]|nr:molybdopterin-dependent oxidoreductase [Longimicrobiaceae bacterium]